jgi:hypothetical protein
VHTQFTAVEQRAHRVEFWGIWILMILLTSLLFACSEPTDALFEFAEPGAAPAMRGPGGPEVSFQEADLWKNCAYLNGGPDDWDHHNLVMPYRGHLVLPWAAEWGRGGLSFFEFSDPCNPVKISDSLDAQMRETHAIGMVHLPEGDPYAGDWAAVNYMFGIQIWDISDETAPVPVVSLDLPGVVYPDSYARVSLSLFWQYPYLFVAAADNGVFVVDATDPCHPEMIAQYVFDNGLRAGGIFVLGDVALVTAAEQSSAALLDVSIPDDPQLFPGGVFATAAADTDGEGVETYHGNMAGDLAMFARKEGGGGAIVYDISDPTAPTYAGDVHTSGNGGYVFYDEGYLFLGESDFATVFDAADLSDIQWVGEGDLQGDLDTIVPYGNVAVLSVDDEADDDQATAVMPWRLDPDVTGPQVLRTSPRDGAGAVPVSARIGVGFNEPIEPSTVFPGSIRLWDADGEPVEGWGSAQENIASYAPKAPLEPGATYTLEVMAGGIQDINGNPVAETVTATFTTAGGR